MIGRIFKSILNAIAELCILALELAGMAGILAVSYFIIYKPSKFLLSHVIKHGFVSSSGTFWSAADFATFLSIALWVTGAGMILAVICILYDKFNGRYEE